MANDKIEITDAMIADAKRCPTITCGKCSLFTGVPGECVGRIATALEAERAKGPGVWTDAPARADYANIVWYDVLTIVGTTSYGRGLPKTHSRLRAESIIGSKGEKLDGDEWERAVTAVERELG